MKRNLRLFVLPALLIFCFSDLKAQSNYQPGLVVGLHGDTIHGFINYQEWGYNPERIEFKASLSDKSSKNYGINDMSYFSIGKIETYVKYTGPVSTDAVDPAKVSDGRDSSSKIVTVFLKVLEKGPRASLYSYRDANKLRYFIIEGAESEPKELIYRIYMDRSSAANNSMITEYTYRKQLSAVAVKYNELDDKLTNYIARAEYNDDILDVVSRINHITKADYAKNHPSGPSFSLYAGAGLNMNTTIPSPYGPFYQAGARSYSSFLPAAFFGINFFVNPATRKLQFGLQLTLSQSNLRESYDSKVLPYVPTVATYNTFITSGSLHVTYNVYNGENFKVSLGLGVIASSYSFSGNYIGAKDHNNGAIDLNATEPWLFNTFNDAYLFRVGVQFAKHLEVFGEYQTSIEPSTSPYYELSSNSKQVGLIYLFK